MTTETTTVGTPGRGDGVGHKRIYELTEVRRYFKKNGQTIQAIDGIDLTIAEGEFLAVQGPTGQGKSTLLSLLGGLDHPTAGRIVFDGRDLATLHEGELAELRASAFGFAFQTFNLIPTLTAQENVEAALVPFHVARNERQRRAEEALAALGLGHRTSHFPSELSGGEQQRVAIARALVKNPRVLLADEPTGNLDEEMRDEIVGVLVGLWHDRGLTLVIVTHDSTVARRAQRIVVIAGGRLSLGQRHVFMR